MIKKLRLRFIRLALIALTLAMFVVVGVVDLAMWLNVKSELYQTLNFISETNMASPSDAFDPRLPGGSRRVRVMAGESSWARAFFDAEGELKNINITQLVSKDEDTAREAALKAYASQAESGFYGIFLYRRRLNQEGTGTVTLLDCENRLRSVNNLLLTSFIACLGGIALAFVILVLSSKKAIMPTIRNMERQKQFITNASHELKTPITVISTNMELLETEYPGSQWVKGTLKQTGIMKKLVDEMVYLSRLEEENSPLNLEKTELKPLFDEVSEPFAAMAEYKGLEMQVNVPQGLYMAADRALISRLISTLLDNSVKYAVPGEPICLSAAQEGKNVSIKLSNKTDTPLSRQDCERLFERFYRAEESRFKTEDRQGFGIGLSIASAICEKHSGSIRAQMRDGDVIEFICTLRR
ncbi:MAG: HAMP domain-containing histidine kinase [Clostridiales bacterium]|nr:HAMP domain-containing histidine kinase [Clostridiales bacterium]